MITQAKMEPIPYEDFRTGLTFEEVYYMLWNHPHKTRHTVLGKWRQIKLEMYAEYLQSLEPVDLPF